MENQLFIIIREVRFEDLYPFYQILSNPNVYKKIDLDRPPSMEEEIQWFHSIKLNRDLVWTLEYQGKVIGNSRIFIDNNLPEYSAEFGIMIDEAYWGKGIGKFVCKWLIDYADKQLQLDRLYLEVMHGNNNARKLYSNLGFQSVEKTNTHEKMVIQFTRERGRYE